ncbi:uncharacterized protein TNIN_22351 [Trichonephila inaurata madagascariensis]|uniref:Uncharacterized protein n=1 Tax=Trichonephila inaurata madagascariensis TaxID=2747483 RepID=A0A8X7BS69_9ARAC|nr:uncharacterized protein TNIN_22351 [Trichonephila inaurata madagascariensis]
MNISHGVENLEMHYLPSSTNITNRTLSVDAAIEPPMDTTSTVLAIDPVGTLLLWTLIEVVALGFLTTATFKSIHLTRFNYYYPHHVFDSPPYDDFPDTFEFHERKGKTINDESFVPSNSTWSSKRKGAFEEVHNYILKRYPMLCSKKNTTISIK